ncbi:hypothetical protein [Nocardiopsis ansamitocini]|uniref:Uncharacterized protein n=1 Tax=Nocardiopsis ansamitocini TaxID=1670832 RepID=A0A9W6PBI7_9ACTN|nr:hypothetical protein [Nocardiopsis ansamitocini]GLU50518.1 hypothetical protein Nans01_48690 [Nocardiopsis ansamitocini]
MTITLPDGVVVSVTTVQVVKGGEVDEDTGISLAGKRSPRYAGLNQHCACYCAPLPHDLWEAIERHDLYSPRTDVWLRVLDHGDTAPLPEGARVLMSRTVVCGSD